MRLVMDDGPTLGQECTSRKGQSEYDSQLFQDQSGEGLEHHRWFKLTEGMAYNAHKQTLIPRRREDLQIWCRLKTPKEPFWNP